MRVGRTLKAVVLVVGLSAATAVADDFFIYLSDQNLDAIVRIQDINDDGDTLDVGEVIVFCDEDPPLTGIENTQGIVVLGPGELLAADNFDPVNIVHLIDLNGDGDAEDPGEADVWFHGGLPGGFRLAVPTALAESPDGDEDLEDLAALLSCMGGPAGEAPPGSRLASFHKTDTNGDVDLADASAFQIAFADSGD